MGKKRGKRGRRTRRLIDKLRCGTEMTLLGAFPGDSVIPIIHEVDDLNSEEGLAVREYIEAHVLLPEAPCSLPLPFIQTQGKRLRETASIEEKKGILLLLAHHGSPESLGILEEYAESPDEGLHYWARLALEESRTFVAVHNGLYEMEDTARLPGASGSDPQSDADFIEALEAEYGEFEDWD
ncbi:hypothetical protein JW905_15360 [bacterium]|nr:hypothetical protein [candidate division CSSED10-310 bacterium]